MTLTDLLAHAGVAPEGIQGDAEITSLSADSRHTLPGALHVCYPSKNSDSHQFALVAVEKGAKAAMAHSRAGFEMLREKVPTFWIGEEGFSEAIWKITRQFYQSPTAAMKLVGVTGTNGKTTTCWLLTQLMEQAGLTSGYLGTLGLTLPSGTKNLENTTPFAVDLYSYMAQARDEGVNGLAMEVSSHALEEKRCDGLEFDVALLTNVTQDHLDFHGSMEAYKAAKLRLFTELPKESEKPFTACLNVDDPTGLDWAASLGCKTLTYGMDLGDFRASPQQVGLECLDLDFLYKGKATAARVGVGGNFNVWNTLSATVAMLALGYELEEIASWLPYMKPAPGRFEPVPNEAGIDVIVDYAHTPDALEKLLQSARALNPVRLTVVFGCGGDRDSSKRPLMAAVASKFADRVVLTSDNPRTEDPAKILIDVSAGLAPGTDSILIQDRAEAVAYAMKTTVPGELVVIAGKGHENYQIIGRVKTPMDDRQLVRDAVNK